MKVAKVNGKARGMAKVRRRRQWHTRSLAPVVGGLQELQVR